MLSKKMLVADLYAFYGELLTEKQKDVLNLYCLEDLSLGEIAEDLGISRQGVYDKVKRATIVLEGYEEKLGLMDQFNNNDVLLNDINQKMIDLMNILNDSKDLGSMKYKVESVVNVVIQDIRNMIE